MESSHIRGMSTAKVQVVLKRKKNIYGKWGFFCYSVSFWGKKKNLCGKTYVRRISVFIVDSMSTLVRLSGSDIPETGGVIILNFACSESRLERK